MKLKTKALLYLGGIAATAAATHFFNKEKHKDICMIAHRGHSSKHPGNTEAAFLSAVKNGSGGIETDVRMTKDGVFVVNHNDKKVYIQSALRMDDDIKMKSELDSLHLTKDFFKK